MGGRSVCANVGLKAPVNSKGVTDVYLRYQANGEVTYRLPVIVGGSTMNERDLDVAIDVGSGYIDWFE